MTENQERSSRHTGAVFAATGSFIPSLTIPNEAFLTSLFFNTDGTPVEKEPQKIIDKFKEITGIAERRYGTNNQKASDLGFLSATAALSSSGIDKEKLDYIIVAHNFGDMAYGSNRTDMVPTLASRIKHKLQIQNPDCVAYDLPFGCPGWLEGVIQANYFIRSGDARYCMVIGTEMLSRVIDPHDRDSMLYSDGSGAVIMAAGTNNATEEGIIAHKTQTHALDHALLLKMGRTYAPHPENDENIYLKMKGRKLYEFALTQVPLVVRSVLDKAKLHIRDIAKVLIHQANEKMDLAILERLFKLYNEESIPQYLMPMTISTLGNNSVATIPILLDFILKGKIKNHQINRGDKAIFASVGAGMNINALVYQF
ncbi:ketoacyl-ACP synthase III [Agriterribacter sp.]|uniref:3-oxoacyl-ACP synthase III family protein n=1 Tax=Agriterribacter sp. TaxID=2821509 RepID=UPI002C4C4ABA|nr:ketoacyl-ACP synthase III [Agriterribacter sp.]HRP56771.1 ketoacyl-ACP synthase III [Agriterribacter sp.]